MGVIIRQSVKGTVINYVGVAIGAITTLFVLTRFLTTEEIGLTRVLIEAATMLSGLAQLGTTSSILRYYPYFKGQGNKDNGFFFWTLIIPIIGIVIFGLLFIMLKSSITDYFSDNSPLFNNYVFYVLPLAVSMVYMSVFESNSNVLMSIAVPKFVREILIRMLLLVVYLLYAFKVLNINGFVAAFCLAYFIAMIVDGIYLLFFKKIKFKPDTSYLTKHIVKDYFSYTSFLIVGAVAGIITPFLNTFFISAEMGLSFTGIYAIAVFISSVVDIPFRSLGAISQPQISQSVKNHDIDEVNKLCKNVSLHQLIIGSLLFSLIWFNTDAIFQFIPKGDIYASGKSVVFILGLYKLTTSTLSIGTTVLTYSKYYYYSLLFTFVMTAGAIYLNYSLIPLYGMNGAAMATLLSNILFYVLILLFNKIKFNTSPFSWKQCMVLLILAGMFVINQLWDVFITNNIINADSSLLLVATNALSKSAIILSVAVFTIYKLKISTYINRIIDKRIRRA